MRIVFFVHRYWPSVGGVEKYIHRLGQALQEMGHVVHVVAGVHADGLLPTEVHEGIKIHRYPAHRSPARAWWHLIRMRRLFLSADVIHVSDTFVLEYFYRMVAWTIPQKPVFLTRHGMSYLYPVPEREKERARRSLTLVDGILHDGCFIERHLGVAPDCVPDQGLYPEADDLPNIPDPAPASATFVGRLEPDTGVHIYVDAIRVLRDEHNLRITLHAYGDGSLKESLQAKAVRENLRVVFHGWQPGAQERITDGCFAFVAGRMAMQEAMARRRLVVAACVDPLKRDYVNGEPFSPFLLSGGDAATIAELVARYARDDQARRALIERAFEYARTLNWKRTALEYLKLWERAPRRPSRGRPWLARARWAWTFAAEARHAARGETREWLHRRFRTGSHEVQAACGV